MSDKSGVPLANNFDDPEKTSLAFEWATYLLHKGTPVKAMNALDHFHSLGWISDEVRYSVERSIQQVDPSDVDENDFDIPDVLSEYEGTVIEESYVSLWYVSKLSDEDFDPTVSRADEITEYINRPF